MKTNESSQLLLRVEELEQRIAPWGSGQENCDNGWGNGEDCAPGNSLEHQPKFEDPNTGETPSSSPEAADGDR